MPNICRYKRNGADTETNTKETMKHQESNIIGLRFVADPLLCCVAYRVWCVVEVRVVFVWCVSCGARCVVSGAWCVMFGVWCVLCAVFCVCLLRGLLYV